MSLARMALRTAAVLALTNYYQKPYPTIANARVFDSRLDPIQGADKTDIIPSITIYTDEDSGDGLSENNGGPPFRRKVSMSLWLTLGMIGEDNDVGEQQIMLPQTDLQLEAMLDLFEYQVRFALADYKNTWSRLYLGMQLRTLGWSSDRMASEGNVRLAARQITATIEIDDDLVPLAALETPDPLPLPDNVQAILDAVTDAGGTPLGDVAATIALMQSATIPTTLTFDKLKTIWLKETHPDTADGPITPMPTASLGNLYPDDVAAVALTVSSPVMGTPTVTQI